jgi:hypothetical protein
LIRINDQWRVAFVQNCPAMPSNTHHRWKVKLGIALLLAGQLFSIAHAAEFGTIPHEHNGVVCLAALNNEQDEFLPPYELAPPSFNSQTIAENSPHRFDPAKRSSAILPPATGPPSI